MTTNLDGSVSVRGLRTGALAGLVGQAVVIGSGVLTQILLARLLAPEKYGAYTLITTLVYLVAILIRLGLHQVVVRAAAAAYLAEGRGRAAAVARRIVLAAVIASAAALPVLAFLVVPKLFVPMFDGDELDGLSLVLAGTVVIEALRVVVAESLRGLHHQTRATLVGNAWRAVLVLLPIVAIGVTQRHTSFSSVLWVLLGASTATLATASIAFALVVFRRHPATAGEQDSLPAVYRAGLPFLVTELTAAAMLMGDVVVIGNAVPHGQLALYAAASRVAALIAVPAFVATTVLAPAIASLWRVQEVSRLQTFLRGYGLMAAVPAVVAFVGFLTLGDALLSLLFGPYYEAGWPYLVILAVGGLGNTIFGFAGGVLMMVGRAQIVVRVTILAAALTLGLEVVAVNYWGLKGVAVAAVAGVVGQQVTLTIICARATGLWALPGAGGDLIESMRERS